jgi:hypothetical protein
MMVRARAGELRTFTSSAAMYKIYGWLTVVAGTGEGSRWHEDRLITARRPADMVGNPIANTNA